MLSQAQGQEIIDMFKIKFFFFMLVFIFTQESYGQNDIINKMKESETSIIDCKAQYVFGRFSPRFPASTERSKLSLWDQLSSMKKSVNQERWFLNGKGYNVEAEEVSTTGVREFYLNSYSDRETTKYWHLNPKDNRSTAAFVVPGFKNTPYLMTSWMANVSLSGKPQLSSFLSDSDIKTINRNEDYLISFNNKKFEKPMRGEIVVSPANGYKETYKECITSINLPQWKEIISVYIATEFQNLNGKFFPSAGSSIDLVSDYAGNVVITRFEWFKLKKLESVEKDVQPQFFFPIGSRVMDSVDNNTYISGEDITLEIADMQKEIFPSQVKDFLSRINSSYFQKGIK